MGDIISFFEYDFPNLIKDAVVGSIIGQYISDVFFNIFVFEKQNVYDVITDVSETPAYIAATTSGFLNGITAPYIDDLTSVGFRNVAYVWTNDYASRKLNEDDFIDFLDFQEVTQDTIAVIIIVWAFSKKARHTFIDQKRKKNNLEPLYAGEKNDIFTSIVVVLGINLYAYYKYRRDNNTLSGVDRSIDLVD